MNIPNSSSVPVIIISDFDSNPESAILKSRSEDKHGKLSKSIESQKEAPEDERLKSEIRKADTMQPGERERIKTKHKVRLVMRPIITNIIKSFLQTLTRSDTFEGERSTVSRYNATLLREAFKIV